MEVIFILYIVYVQFNIHDSISNVAWPDVSAPGWGCDRIVGGPKPFWCTANMKFNNVI